MIRYTVFPDLGAQTKVECYEPWETLVGRVTHPRVTFTSKSEMPLISCGQFGALRTQRGSLRSKMNLVAVHGIEIDYDDEVVALSPVLDLLDAANVAALGYCSPSHRPGAPRWRLLCPLSRDRPPSDRVVYVEMINALLAGIAASESARLAQSFYIGKCGAFYTARATLSVRPIDEAGELPRLALGEPKAAPADDVVVAPRRPRPEGDSVIARWNAAQPVTALLDKHGYKKHDDGRWLAPQSRSGIAGVILLDDGRIYSHHGPLDPLSNSSHAGHGLDSFDLLRILECGGDVAQALALARYALAPEAAR